ncbi:FoF1 ATP synthase subunit delta/epsilon [Arenibacter latericius]|uniref:FoF1 ATP synthase subunit delta/epsilon n=1 Tax=Arenibacter latericius TaxID=86104 RepID=UPI00040DDB09|nr:F0F1 ATP synthase subunit epsilon [Arenibacter latericius]MDX1363757.1 F0F1 ATP synthase subunit epsilon [Arenibacter latericius]
MYLEIVSPEATLFTGEVTAVTVPGVKGEFQMLNNHAPIISLLEEGNVKIKGNVTVDKNYESKFTKDANGDTVLHITSGTVEMKNNRIIILAD